MDIGSPPSRLGSRVRKVWSDRGLFESTGPDVRLSMRDQNALVRAAIFVLLALLSLPDVGNTSALLPAFLCLVAISQPIAVALAGRRSLVSMIQVGTDIMVAVVAAILAPQYSMVIIMGLITLAVSHATIASVRISVPVATACTAAISVVALLTDVPNPWRTGIVAGLLTLAGGHMGYDTRKLVRAARRDLHLAIHAAGGLTHLSDVGSATFELGGDIEPLLGYTNEEWLAIPRVDMVHPDDLAAMRVDSNEVWEGNILDRTGRFRSKSGEWVWIRDVSRVVMHRNRPHLHGFLINVSAERNGLDKVASEASTDQLTGLANRRALLDELRTRRDDSAHALVLIDLNGFKEVNDTLGHDAGDQLLQVVAERLTACVRPGDRLARLGGDEFAIVIADVIDVGIVVSAVERIAFEVSRPVEINGVRISTSLSAGIAESSPASADGLTMLRHADMAMYAAKRAGRTSAIFDQPLELELERRRDLMETLPQALADGSLALQYQPIVDATTGEVVSAEGLARWAHPQFGALSPIDFLDVVLLSERSGEFTRAMVSHALMMWKRMRDEATAISIAVNIPVPVLEDKDFEDWFAAERTRLDCDGSDIVFEVAERDFHHTEATTAAIERFTALGVAISVDDFGTGHATFERLRWRGVEQLKIEREMVSGAIRGERDCSILESVAGLATSLGYTIVAEGVETVEQLDLLREFGIEHIQGWLFAKAMSPDDLVHLIRAGGFTTHAAFTAPVESFAH